jgi:hypothetical protein
VLEKYAERRCKGTNAKGERCRKYAIPGGFMCRTHGGSTRHQINKARIRLEMQAIPLVRKLAEIAFDDTKPAAVQLDAVKDSLNRIGVTKPAQVEVGPITPFEEIFDGIVSGPRSESRQSRDIGEPESIDPQDNHFDLSGPFEPEPVEYQDVSKPVHPAPATRKRASRYPPITGEDAIRLANQMRALPPGDSSG